MDKSSTRDQPRVIGSVYAIKWRTPQSSLRPAETVRPTRLRSICENSPMSSRPFPALVPTSSLDFYAQAAIDSPNVAYRPLLDGGTRFAHETKSHTGQSDAPVVSNNNTLHAFDTLPIKLIRRHHGSLPGFVPRGRTHSSGRAAPSPTHAPPLGHSTQTRPRTPLRRRVPHQLSSPSSRRQNCDPRHLPSSRF
jgi:hypothetical protein